jgi:hypothetical protein
MKLNSLKALSFLMSISTAVLTVSLPANAQPRSCSAFYAKTDVVHQKILLNKLDEIPTVQDFIGKMVGDPLIPLKIKRILAVSLAQDNISVKELTQEIREIMGVSKGIVGLYINSMQTYRLKKDVNSPPSLNDNLSSTIDVSTFKMSGQTVFAADNYPNIAQDNPVIALIHELAHVRFEAFLGRNLNVIIKTFPHELIHKADDGVIEISSDLHNFLHERYAFESQYEVLRATEGRSGYYPQTFQMLGHRFPMNSENYREVISKYVIQKYGIGDPLVTRLENQPLSDILKGRAFRHL